MWLMFFLPLIATAQKNTLQVTITDANVGTGRVLCLRCFQNGSFYTEDSTTVTEQNKGLITLNTHGYMGTCELNFSYRRDPGAEVIVNPVEPNVKVTAGIQDIENGTVKIDNSIENKLYNQMKAARNIYDRRLNQLLKAKRQLIPLQPTYIRDYQSLDNQLSAIKDSINRDCDAITAKYPNLFASQVTKSLIKLPTRGSSPEGKNYDTEDAFLFEHYFDYFDFNNPLLIKHYAFNYLLEQYFSQYTNNKDKYLLKSCDMLMKKASGNTDVKNYIYNFLLDYGLTRNIEYMVKHLQDGYGDDCDLGLDIAKSNSITSINNTKEGATAPDILLYDENSNPQSLNQYVKKNKLTVVVFWVSWCAHCKKELPILASYQEEWKKNKVGLFTVGLDEKKEDWTDYVKRYNLTGINVAELVPLKNAKVLPLYNIRTTPALFVLDSKGTILKKNIFGTELKTFIDSYTGK